MTQPVRRSTSPTRRWSPTRELEDIYEQMGQLLPAMVGRGLEHPAWVPAADLSETEDAYVVEVELPGVKPDDVNVEVSGGELAITGEVKERERKGLLRHRTRRVGEFEYRVSLPNDIDADNIEASLSEGVLSVRVPKAERAKPRRVEISKS